MPVKAYSYLRYSSVAQKKGDSLRRQLEAAQDWAAGRPDIELDTSTRDLGVSAFKGQHRVKGALSSFLRKVEAGEIARGSYLLVESFDRLSRETEMVAVNLLTSITLAGIRVVTLADGHEYHEGSDAMDIMRAVIVMSRAHNENLSRGKKIAAAWADKKRRARETGEKLSRRGPAWTLFNEATKEFDLIPARAAVVQRIFAECNDGLGITAIASRLNAEGVPPFVAKSDGWHQGYVLTILRSPSTTGLYQPTLTTNRPGQRMQRRADGDVIAEYYPRVVSDEIFDRAQGMIARRNKRGGGKGRRGKTFPNILIGLGRCEDCGGTLILGSRANSSAVRHYRCYQEGRKHGCENRRRYLCSDVEEHLEAFLVTAKLDDHDLNPDRGHLMDRIAARDELQKKIEALLDQVEAGSSAITERLRQREAELVEIEREITTLKVETQTQPKSGQDALRAAFAWLESLTGASDADLYSARAKANALLNEHFDWVIPREGGLLIARGQDAWSITDEALIRYEIEPTNRPTRDNVESGKFVTATMI
ncbi:MAG: recombinase family protein [Caulobacterales bacterium]|nr:recombinase family protein [Caulobacterales bacterium]